MSEYQGIKNSLFFSINLSQIAGIMPRKREERDSQKTKNQYRCAPSVFSIPPQGAGALIVRERSAATSLDPLNLCACSSAIPVHLKEWIHYHDKFSWFLHIQHQLYVNFIEIMLHLLEKTPLNSSCWILMGFPMLMLRADTGPRKIRFWGWNFV